jgi:uncharacterized protein (DUF1697 family)
MAYITSEEAKEIRENVKKAFPSKDGYKFSITVKNYSSLNVVILQSPFEFENNRKDGYSIRGGRSGENTKEEIEFIEKLNSILNKNNYDNSNSMIDYFDVGYYVFVTLGKYNKEYVCSK